NAYPLGKRVEFDLHRVDVRRIGRSRDDEHTLGRWVQLQRQAQRLAVGASNSYGCNAMPGTTGRLVGHREPRKDDRGVAEHIRTVVQDELQRIVRDRDHQIDVAGPILLANVVRERSRRDLGAEAIVLEILRVVVDWWIAA